MVSGTVTGRADGAAGVGGVAADSRAVRLVNVTKRYGENVALRNVSLDIVAGTIHGFIGENGAGKSTCFGLLAGRHAPTSGTVEILGHVLTGRGPREARAAGVAAIYQELSFAPTLTATENTFLGQELTNGHHRLKRNDMRRRFLELTRELGVTIDPDVRMTELSLAQAQLVEIIRSLASQAQLIMFDEPTTSLSHQDRERLYAVMRSLRRQGVTQLFVSHNLDEVLALCDTVTVFRDGALVETRPAADWDKPQMVAAMAGRTVQTVTREAGIGVDVSRPPALAIEHLRVGNISWDVKLEVRHGEILGIAGLTGSGRSTLLRSIAGAERQGRGAMQVDGAAVRWPTRVVDARRLRIALLPEDRKGQGLLLESPVIESLLLGSHATVTNHGLLSRRRSLRVAAEAAELARLDPGRLLSPAASLSGGNQQKILVARWIHAKPVVLLCDEPTRGVDIAARHEIWEAMYGLAARGTAIIVVSSDFAELTENCDRILVMARRRVVAELCSREERQTSTIVKAIFEAEESR